MNITGIILAGGKSSRMGSDKGLLKVDGLAMVQHVINAVAPVVSNIIIIANNKEYEQFGYPVYADLIKEKGPVGGIYTGLSFTQSEANICVSCDVPLVSTKLFELLLKESKGWDVTLPKYNGKIHPLMGVYQKSTIQKFKESAENDQLKLRLVTGSLNCKIVSIEKSKKIWDERVFSNINTEEELKNITNESEC